jgi:signal transduction histidine kinase
VDQHLNSHRNDGVHRLGPGRVAWVPVPVLLAVTIVFWAAGLQSPYESIYLLLVLNIVFVALVCLVAAYLITRSFLARGAPGLLLLGCGVVLWGPAGVVATAVARGDANISITVYNSCVWLSGLCHLAGVLVSLRSRRSLSPAALWLPVAYALAVGAVVLVALAALAGWIPPFFLEDRGRTPVHQVVLFSAAVMFSFTALLLDATRRRPASGFVHWYALALLLMAIGLFGVMLQTYHASILGWTGRATQSLGGLYLLGAAIASVRESRVWRRSLEQKLRKLNETLERKVALRTAELERRSRQLQKLTLELTQAEDRERQRVAAVLHEDLQQHLAGAKFHLSALKRRARDDPQFAVVDHVDEMLREAIEKSRNLSHDLSPVLLHMNDLGEVLQWLATRARNRYGLTVHTDIRNGTALASEALTMFLFRAAQEILFNVAKHAQVHEATLRVRHAGHYLYLSVTDRGCGFDPQALKHTPGFGLLSIRERLELLDGRMKIRSTRGQGSTVVLAVPSHNTPSLAGSAGSGPRATWHIHDKAAAHE